MPAGGSATRIASNPRTVTESIVIDTNLVFSALVSQRARLREVMFAERGFRLHAPRFLFVELFKHKERILQASQLPEDELLDFLNVVLARLDLVEEGAIPMGVWVEARRLCVGTDENDTPFVALALHLGVPLWTGDEELKKGLMAEGFDHFFDPEFLG